MKKRVWLAKGYGSFASAWRIAAADINSTPSLIATTPLRGRFSFHLYRRESGSRYSPPPQTLGAAMSSGNGDLGAKRKPAGNGIKRQV